jgi:hypothetical protein
VHEPDALPSRHREPGGVGLPGGVGEDVLSGPGDFPWCRCNVTACSVTVARSRSTSARASASAAVSALTPGRPGTAAARASRAPCFAVRQTPTTVDRSTPHFSAASRWVACWVRTCTKISYFSDGASRRRSLPGRVRPGPGFDFRFVTVLQPSKG